MRYRREKIMPFQSIYTKDPNFMVGADPIEPTGILEIYSLRAIREWATGLKEPPENVKSKIFHDFGTMEKLLIDAEAVALEKAG